MLQDRSLAAVTSHITGARFATYTSHANGDTRRALELYRWNIHMSGALQEALAIAEVFLRNSIDAQLRIWNSAQPPSHGVVHTDEWVRTPAGPLWAILHPKRRSGGRFSTYDDAFSRAKRDCSDRDQAHRRHGHPVDHDDVIAHMSFGAWNSLLPRTDNRDPSGIGPKGQRRLWTEALYQAFPHHSDPLVIKYWVDRLHGLRNRVAHLEPLCDTDVMSYHRTSARLLGAIDPALSSWYAGISRVPAIYRTKPV